MGRVEDMLYVAKVVEGKVALIGTWVSVQVVAGEQQRMVLYGATPLIAWLSPN